MPKIDFIRRRFLRYLGLRPNKQHWLRIKSQAKVPTFSGCASFLIAEIVPKDIKLCDFVDRDEIDGCLPTQDNRISEDLSLNLFGMEMIYQYGSYHNSRITSNENGSMKNASAEAINTQSTEPPLKRNDNSNNAIVSHCFIGF